MPLSRGDKLGPYEILALVGKGAMGEVYRAHDYRLRRDVAIKVSNTRFTERFNREARAIASLNHTNICTLHDVGPNYLVMEYVEGKNLHGPMDFDKALPIVQQLIDGIEAAHEKNIVHRDLKPANIRITPEGVVKILDFGLAKAIENPSSRDRDPEYSPTLPIGATEPGTILGTAAYMAPEQVEGKAADRRSDIWSFGVVLYEMLTGKRLFQGESNVEIWSGVLTREPDISAAPVRVHKLLRWCLEKDRKQRLAAIGDARRLLLEDVASPPAVVKALRLRGAITAAVVVSVLAGAYFVYQLSRTSAPKFQQLTFRHGDVKGARFAPDGNTIIYAAAWDGAPDQIFSTIIGARESRPLGPPSGKLLSVSRSGEMAVLVGGGSGLPLNGTLSRVSLAGGAPREILEGVSDADWAPDSTTLAVIRSVGTKNQLEFPIGTVLFQNEGRPPITPRVSPQGDCVAFFEFNELGNIALALVRNGGDKKILSEGLSAVGGLAWSADGKEIWFFAVSGEGPALRAVNLSGTAERVIVHTPGYLVLYDIGRDGKVLAAQTNSRIAMMYRGASDDNEQDLSWQDTSYLYDISADGKNLLFVEMSYSAGRNPGVYLRKTDASQAVRLGNCRRPTLSPDGRWVVCIESEPQRSTLLVLPTRAGEAWRIADEGIRYESVEWMPDGRRILFSGSKNNDSMQTYLQLLDGGSPVPVQIDGLRVGPVSPDSQYVVGVRDGKFHFYPLESRKEYAIGSSLPGETVLRWFTGSGRSFFTASPDGAGYKVFLVNATTGAKKLWTEIRLPESAGVLVKNISITPDGRSYAYSYQRDLSDLYLISGLR